MANQELRNFVLCGTCLDLFEELPAAGSPTPQRCRCRSTDEPVWPGHDFNEHLHLCECCRLVPLRSGSRWSVWFCGDCKSEVMDLNRLVGHCVIPIGRHSLMAGVGLAGRELTRARDSQRDELLSRFIDQSQGLFDAMDHLHAFSKARTVVLSDAVGLHGDVRLDTWLDRIGELAGARPQVFGASGSFRALVDWFDPG
ncbi:MAG TPA: hypothetical protein VFM81_05660 [Actinomycetota bacterium]|nr:hypothetical protein [Actinomycetota bacterium]